MYDSTQGADGSSDGDTGTQGQFPCGTATCDPGEVCFTPCYLCNAALLCQPANEAGVCPAGTEINSECPSDWGCRVVCVDTPYCTTPDKQDSCIEEFEGEPSDPRYCTEACG